MKLEKKVAIITGAGRGIGRAIAMRFAQEGASIVVDDIDSVTARQTAEEISNAGGTALAFKADVTDRAEVDGLVRATLENFKAIHILVNNAGITRDSPLTAKTEEEWDAVVDTDLKGVFNCIQAVAKHMIQQRYGKIVNISSVVALGGTSVGMADYAPAKAGVVALTMVAARELGPYGINVNSIAPGAIMTDMTHARRTEDEVKRFIAEKTAQSVLRRVGYPQDIANAALFLVSEDSAFIAGHVLRVDGGRTDRL